MPPRFFYGNFDFEHQLADSGFQTSSALNRINAELAASWLAVAEDGDYLWCPEPISAEFFAEAANRGLPRVVPISDAGEVPVGVEFVPWGWTERMWRLASSQRWRQSAADSQAVRDANSRVFSSRLECSTNSSPAGCSAVVDIARLDDAFRKARRISVRVVIKANWGMSGRERIFVADSITEAHAAWARQRIAKQGAVFVEPWLDRLEEIGIQLKIPQYGETELVGVASLACDELGQYRGSWFTEPPGTTAETRRWRQVAVDHALHAAEMVRQTGYFGPLGIDAMRYRLPDGSIRCRWYQDINARWTMGRLAWGWRRRFPNGKRGFWWHGPASETPTWPGGADIPCRIIRTSPERVGDLPASRAAYLLLAPG